uniref:F-box domain-containing protein n=1 Tax=Vitis vinifera TaxID=29760 RepID=A5C3G1_VITVI|nr:hypothetical protein VITISV_015276 [Vitis vinifera]
MACSTIEPPPTTTTVVQSGIAALHPDILETHILTRLDGPTLASASCADTKLHALSTQPDLWITICTSTWPSTSTPRLLHLMSSFPDGPRSFFSSSYPILHRCTNSSTNSDPSAPPVRLISAVDIYYNEKPIISKVQETETATEWFRCSPFRIDVLDPKDVVPTSIQHPGDDDTSRKLGENISLSWIVMDTTGRRAANLSSHKAVSVERHWLSGEVQLRFASILGGDKGTTELVQCRDSGDLRRLQNWGNAGDRGELAVGGHGWSAFDGEGEFGNFAQGPEGPEGEKSEEGAWRKGGIPRVPGNEERAKRKKDQA